MRRPGSEDPCRKVKYPIGRVSMGTRVKFQKNLEREEEQIGQVGLGVLVFVWGWQKQQWGMVSL